MPAPKEMIQLATQAMQKAYAPYSHFTVGSCLRTNAGTLYAGCNVENASYGLTVCAESNAIAAMVSAGEKNLQEIVVVIPGKNPCPPCGACRQRIFEFASNDAVVHCHTTEGQQASYTLRELLPFAFGPNNLEP